MKYKSVSSFNFYRFLEIELEKKKKKGMSTEKIRSKYGIADFDQLINIYDEKGYEYIGSHQSDERNLLHTFRLKKGEKNNTKKKKKKT